MREFLVTKFVCAQCGTNLELSTEKPEAHASNYSDDEPRDLPQIAHAARAAIDKATKEKL